MPRLLQAENFNFVLANVVTDQVFFGVVFKAARVNSTADTMFFSLNVFEKKYENSEDIHMKIIS